MVRPPPGVSSGLRVPPMPSVNPRESAIFKLWETRGLNTGELDPGQVVAFVKQLLHLL